MWLCVGPAAAATQLVVRGGDDAQRENIERYLQAVLAEDLPDAQLRARARAEGERALQALGHYRPQITLGLQGGREARRLEFRFTPGPPVRISRLRLELRGGAVDDPAFARLREQLPLSEGDVFHHGRYESIKSALHNLALSRGYFNAAFLRQRVELNPARGEAAIALIFDSGPRARLGEVSFSDTPFRQRLLERFVPFEAGTPYSTELVAQLNRRLLDSQYFADVRVRPRTELAPEDAVPVDVELSARDKHRVNLGVGYSTDVGARTRLNWRRPWINDRGHKVGVELELAQRRQSISGTYDIPMEDPLRDSLQLQTGWQRESVEDVETERVTLAVQRQWSLDSGWRPNLFLRFEQERFKVGLERGTTQLLIPGVTVSRTRSRGGADPWWGDRQLFSLELAEDSLLSETDLVRLRLGTRWLRTYGGTHRLQLRLDLGALEAGDFSDVPPSLRFFAGGDHSVRGFAWQSIGPEDEAGNVVGGRYLASASLEYSYPVLPRWRLATFVDIGDAFDQLNQRDYKVGTGFGLHWSSPVGPVRLDLAWGVSEDNPPFRVHISVGSAL
ncbi:autotransporter assembly complex protein TamA [Alkalilimnicola sp. S0819]|uniref:autotransporter assembly complex protein TamA n=1 Tax=Alkalilimnicola sp. S0819 TaxID=2613922 RepID=UPI001869716C|nr:autotransporter assembly complex family protein [Alkalilimnicola sp. S0819]